MRFAGFFCLLVLCGCGNPERLQKCQEVAGAINPPLQAIGQRCGDSGGKLALPSCPDLAASYETLVKRLKPIDSKDPVLRPLLLDLRQNFENTAVWARRLEEGESKGLGMTADLRLQAEQYHRRHAATLKRLAAVCVE